MQTEPTICTTNGMQFLQSFLNDHPNLINKIRDNKVYRQQFYHTLCYKQIKYQDQPYTTMAHRDIGMTIASLCNELDKPVYIHNGYRYGDKEGVISEYIVRDLNKAGLTILPLEFDTVCYSLV